MTNPVSGHRKDVRDDESSVVRQWAVTSKLAYGGQNFIERFLCCGTAPRENLIESVGSKQIVPVVRGLGHPIGVENHSVSCSQRQRVISIVNFGQKSQR